MWNVDGIGVVVVTDPYQLVSQLNGAGAQSTWVKYDHITRANGLLPSQESGK